jgi:DNA topoisomerase VI subunit B
LTVSDHDEQPPQKVSPPYPPSTPFILDASHTISQNESQPLFSEQKSRMDYIMLNGIRDRTGFEKEELYVFVLKELLDNALDYVEKNYIEGCEVPELKVFIIRKSHDKDYLTLKVQNSYLNQASISTTSVLTIETLRSIFNFDSFFSSKRNQYRISRGALGDALKEVICIPYAIAKEYYNIEWDRPVVITTGNEKYSISLKIDRINQKIDAKIIQQQSDSETGNKTYTEFEIHLPLIDRNNSKVVSDKL